MHAIWHPFYDNPYYFIALQRVAKWLHPRRFAALDPEQTFRELRALSSRAVSARLLGQPGFLTMTQDLAVSSEAVAFDRGRELYRRMTRRRIGVLTLLALLTIISFLLDLSIGQALYRPAQVIAALWRADAPAAVQVILWDIRLPVALSALVVGASLAMAGVQMQTVLNNPLASPFTLGLSAAASFGAALGLVLGVTILPASAVAYAIPANAFLVSMATALFIHRLSRRQGVSTEMIVLLGTTLVFTFTALLEALQYVAPDQALSAVVFWTMGSLARANWPKLAIMSGLLLATWLLFARQAWALTALRLGEARAVSLGCRWQGCGCAASCWAACWRRCACPSSAPSASSAWWGRTWRACWWGRPALPAAGLGVVGGVAAVGGVRGEQDAAARADPADRHCHLAGGRAALFVLILRKGRRA